MKTKIITLRKSVTRENLTLHTRKFFTLTKFKTQYIYVLTKISTGAGQKDFKLGKKMLLYLKNEEEVKAYRTLVLQDFTKISKENKTQRNDTLTFVYIEVNKDTYVQQLNEIAKSDNFNLDAF